MTEYFDNKKPIAIFQPDRAAKLHSSGEYLTGRVALTNITNMSTNVTLKFHKLKCIDEKDYKCKYYVIDRDGAVSTPTSETTRILVKGGLAANVSISQNITGLIGKHDVQLTCSFINETSEYLQSVELFAKNKTDEFVNVKAIAIFKPNKPAKLISAGSYLNGRVTLTNITNISTNATLTFHLLKCEDEKDYKCNCYYNDEDGARLPTVVSKPTMLSVQTNSSRPDFITYIIVSSTETQEYTSLITKQNDFILLRTSTIDSITTHVQSTDKLPNVFRENDTVMFTCSGNIGKPPGKLIWQKTFPKGREPITYSNETTFKEEIHGECLFKGTSHLTVKMYPEDMQATVRCFDESQVNVQGMYLETEPFDVYFQVKQVEINKQPNQKQYDQKTDIITLNCTGDGNPRPTYVWFKKGQNDRILSNKSVYVIQNVIRNNSGVYMCNVRNIIDDIIYIKTNSVEIHIVDNLESPEESDWWMFVKEHSIPFICGVVGVIVLVGAVIVCCICQKKKKNKARCSQKTKSVGITMNTEYATVIRKNNATSEETGDSMLVLNGMDENRDKSRNKQEDLGKTVDVTTPYHINEYAVPSDALHTGTINCQIGPGLTSFKDVKDI